MNVYEMGNLAMQCNEAEGRRRVMAEMVGTWNEDEDGTPFGTTRDF